MFSFGGPKVTVDLANRISAIETSMPKPATAAPPDAGDLSDKGSVPRYALEDHTHKISVQARRFQVVGSSGIATWTFSTPFDAPPVVQVAAETPTGATYINVASVVEGSCTTTKVDIVVQRIAKTQTLASTAIALLGLVLSIFSAAPAATYVNGIARKGST